MKQRHRKTQKAVLKALRSFRKDLLKEYLKVCKSLSKKMKDLFSKGVDTETGCHCQGLVDEEVGKDLPSFSQATVDQAKHLLSEILSGYWKNDPEKLFEILDPEIGTVFNQDNTKEEMNTLRSLKSSYDMAGEDLSKYLNSN